MKSTLITIDVDDDFQSEVLLVQHQINNNGIHSLTDWYEYELHPMSALITEALTFEDALDTFKKCYPVYKEHKDNNI